MPKFERAVAVLCASVLLGTVGCGGCSQESDSAETAPARKGEADLPATPGEFGGVVRFEGPLPPPRRIQVNKDDEACHGAAGEVQDVAVSADGSLANAVVELEVEKLPAGVLWPPQGGGRAIRQKGCSFEPWLLVVPDLVPIEVVNEDPVLHNINTGQWNIAQAAGSPPVRKELLYAGRSLVRVNCNIHSWMEAWIYIASSPYYAVTGSDGRFHIAGVPAGRYRGTITHPALGTERFEIEVPSGGTLERTFTFASR